MFCVSRPPLEVTKEMGSCQARRLVRNFAADLVGPLPGLQDVKNGPKTSKIMVNVAIPGKTIFLTVAPYFFF